MSHPHDALLQAHIDGELAPPAMREVTRHLSRCDACRETSAELARLAHELADAVRAQDREEPAEWSSAASAARGYAALAVAAHAPADAGPGTAGPERRPRLVLEQRAHQPRRGARTPGRAAWRWAAAALLTVTSVAAAAVMGGPLLHRPAAGTITTTAPRPMLSATLRPAGAIAVAAPARGGDVEVALSGAAAGSRLQITITDGAELSVNVHSDSASAEPARFATGDARIAVELPDAVSLVEVTLPATLHSARVLLGNAVVATATDGRVSPAAAADGGIALPAAR